MQSSSAPAPPTTNARTMPSHRPHASSLHTHLRGALKRSAQRILLPTLSALAVLAAGCAVITGGSSAAWVGTWSTAPTGPASRDAAAGFLPQITLQDQTVRMIVRSTIAGSQLRVRLSNEIGDAPLPVTVGAARIALRDKGSTTLAGTSRALTFGGQPSVTIAPKGYVFSDPVDLDVPALADLAVSVYLPSPTIAQSAHFVTRQTQYLVAGGDSTAATTLPATAITGPNWFLLTGVDVKPKAANAAALVALGDSITEGFGEQKLRVDAPAPWPNWPSRLAERLQADPSLARLAVLNAGISGNRVLHDGAQSVPPSAGGLRGLSVFGPKALARFDRDVAAQRGASCVVILEGINDIGQGPSRGEVVSAEQVIAGHQQLIALARAAGLRVIGGTLTPFEGYPAPYHSAENEAKRQTVNAWIRGSGQYDAVIDFDAMLRDPAHPTRQQPAYDSGDHLHPSDAGYKVMADGVDLGMVKRLCLKPL
jgi:lysophospholipase L1-like esterase